MLLLYCEEYEVFFMALGKTWKKMIKVGISICAACICLCASGCNYILEGLSPKPPVVVTLSENEMTLYVGDSYRLQGEASDGDTLSWTTDREGVVRVEKGKITAISAGTAKITAHCSHAQAQCAVTVLPADPNRPPAQLERELVWHDEFDGDALDLTKWGYQIGTHDVYHGIESYTQYWGNNEQQYYTEDAADVADGMLSITATKEAMGDRSYTSARILTRDLATFTYGYFEARIKVPAITGMWPAFWMLPQPTDTTSTNNVYGGWAKSGEIDIMEIRGRNAYESTSALHFGGNWPNNTHKGSSYKLDTSIEEWHVYAVEWTAEALTWYVDGNAYFTLKANEWWTSSSTERGAPFDKPFFLLLNLAVGGNFDGNRLPPEDFTSASMYVDYVRVYEY